MQLRDELVRARPIESVELIPSKKVYYERAARLVGVLKSFHRSI
jgi:hypothetical protein